MYRALVTFSGLISMAEGDIAEVDPKLAEDLLKAGYIEEIEAEPKAEKKTAKKKR